MVWVPHDQLDAEFMESAEELGRVDFATGAIKPSRDRGGLLKEVMAEREDPLVKRVEEVAVEAWRVLGCRDVGRVDIRCDVVGGKELPFILEVSWLPGFIATLLSTLGYLCCSTIADDDNRVLSRSILYVV